MGLTKDRMSNPEGREVMGRAVMGSSGSSGGNSYRHKPLQSNMGSGRPQTDITCHNVKKDNISQIARETSNTSKPAGESVYRGFIEGHQTGNMVVDTGASTTMVNSKLVHKLVEKSLSKDQESHHSSITLSGKCRPDSSMRYERL